MYYAGYSNTEQAPGLAANVSPQANPNQEASTGWQVNTWVSHEEDDKIHFTIAIKKT